MKKFSIALAFLLTLLAPRAIAQQLPVVAQDFPAISNLLKNPGFENGKTGWTASAGTFAANTTAKLQGALGASWDAAASSDTLISSSITIPAGLHGKNGVAYCSFKAATGTATHTLTVDDGTNDLVTAQTIVSSTSIGPRTAVNFIFPSSGSVRLKITAAANEPATYIDGCFLGEATNVQQINQATLYGGVIWPGTSNCHWQRNNTVFGSFSADSDCTLPSGAGLIGNGAAPATKVPAISFASLPAGEYYFVATGTFVTSVAELSSWRITDGTNISLLGSLGSAGGAQKNNVIAGRHYVPNSLSNVTIEFQCLAGSGNCEIQADSADNRELRIWVYKYPTAGEVAYRPELFNWRVDANISGANPSLGTSDVSSYTEITNSGLTLTNNSGNGVLTAQIPCSSTNSPSGTTCSVGDESVGVSFNLPAPGDVLACVSFANEINSNGNAQRASFQIVETPTNAQTISQEGKSRLAVGQNASLDETPLRLCGTFTFSSAGQKVLRLMYEQDVTAITSHTIFADASASVGQRDIHWEVYPLSQTMPAPVLVGSVTSQSTGQERVERVTVANSGTPTVSSQSGSWISSITDSGTGFATLNIAAGTFSSAPTCVCAAIPTVEGEDRVCTIPSMPTTSAVAVKTFRSDSPTEQDMNFSVICMGAK